MQLDPLLGERVFYSWWSLWVDSSFDDLSLVQLVQSLREARSTYPLYPPLQLVESCRLFETKSMDYGKGPDLGKVVPGSSDCSFVISWLTWVDLLN